MERSETFIELFKSLSLFQIKMDKIEKTSENPFYKSKYADLSNILSAIQIPLVESGLVFSQHPNNGKLETIVVHIETGQYMSSTYDISPAKQDPQGIGSAITYARRYALSSILGLNIGDSDNDGNDQIKPESKENWKYPLIGGITTMTALQDYWNDNVELQKDKVFQNEIAKRKGQL